MKNFKYIVIAWCLFSVTAIYGQEEAEKKEAVEAVEEVKPIVSQKVKFGSKEHRALIEGTPDQIESSENILFKTCLALAAVIGVIVLLFALLKKVNKRLGNTGTDNPLRVKNKLVVDSKNYLALVRVYEEELLVSVGPNGMRLISKYALVDKEEAEGTSFENILNNEGNAVIPIENDNLVNSIDLKPIREMTDGKS